MSENTAVNPRQDICHVAWPATNHCSLTFTIMTKKKFYFLASHYTNHQGVYASFPTTTVLVSSPVGMARSSTLLLFGFHSETHCRISARPLFWIASTVLSTTPFAAKRSEQWKPSLTPVLDAGVRG